MTTDIEDQLIAGLRQEVAGIALTSDILGEAARRHGRRTAVRRIMYAAGVVGLAGALAATLAVGRAGNPEPSTRQAPVVSADSANLRLASAVAASDNISYKIKITAGIKSDPDRYMTTEGAFDPVTATGYLTEHWGGGSTDYQRLVNGVLFLRFGGSRKWKLEPSSNSLLYHGGLESSAGYSADPKQLFQALQKGRGHDHPDRCQHVPLRERQVV